MVPTRNEGSYLWRARWCQVCTHRTWIRLVDFPSFFLFFSFFTFFWGFVLSSQLFKNLVRQCYNCYILVLAIVQIVVFFVEARFWITWRWLGRNVCIHLLTGTWIGYVTRVWSCQRGQNLIRNGARAIQRRIMVLYGNQWLLATSSIVVMFKIEKKWEKTYYPAKHPVVEQTTANDRKRGCSIVNVSMLRTKSHSKMWLSCVLSYWRR